MKTIPLTKGHEAIVDDDDYEMLIGIGKWHVSIVGDRAYAERTDRSGVKQKHIRMHRVIMGSPCNMVVDHINRNTLDNRKINLRICSQKHNSRNRKPQNKTSSYKGVYLKNGNRWAAKIGYNGQGIHIGYFDTEELAADAYNKVAKKLHGEFAYLNSLTRALAAIEARLSE